MTIAAPDLNLPITAQRPLAADKASLAARGRAVARRLVAPGDFVDVMTADMQITDPQVIDHLRTAYGYDQPLWMQLLKYLGNVARFDLGFSYRQNIPVIDAIMLHLPASLILMLSSIFVAVLVGVGAGALAAAKVNTLWDRAISAVSVFIFAAPSFWIGIMLIVLFSVNLGWLPIGDMRTIGGNYGPVGNLLDLLHHLTMPALALGLHQAAIYVKVTRGSMLEIAQSDFVRTARAKGLSDRRVTVRHILRNALLPVITVLGLQFASVLSGSVVVEAVFNWPGIGTLLYDGVNSRDYPVVLGIVILSSVIVIVVNLIVDLAYAWLDPRIALD